ncbi:MAG: lysostaphin resistance A-like protein [Halobaculum sp.]
MTLFVTGVAALSVIAHIRLLGPDVTSYEPHVSDAVSLPFDAAVVLGTWLVVRREGWTLASVGLGRAALLPAVAAFGLFWLSAVAFGVATLAATGGRIGFVFEVAWYWELVHTLLTLTVTNGVSEEFVFRGYVQPVCVALAAGLSRRFAPAVGIVAASLLFGVAHIPLAVLGFDASLAAVPWVLLGNLIPGVAYGLLYYLTRNVWYTAFVHGFANAPLVPFDPAAVPAFTTVATLFALLIAVGYRRWARSTDRLLLGHPAAGA